MTGRKAAFALLAAVLLSAFLCGVVRADSTTLRTQVPSEFQLQIRLEGKGKVRIGGKETGNGDSLSLPRLQEIEIEVFPEEGYRVVSLTLNGEPLSLPRAFVMLTGDSVLSLVIEAINPAPQTGESTWIPETVTVLALAFAALTLFIRLRKKQSVK